MPPIELLHKIVGWPGVAVLCGVFPVVCAALLVNTALKNWKVHWVTHIPLLTVSTLKPSPQSVRLKGRIAGITKPLAAGDTSGRAVLVVHVEELDEENGWETRIFRIQTTPFWMDDGTGLIVVDPENLDREFLGEGITPSLEQVDEVIQIMGFSLTHVQEPGLRLRVWELRKEQQVTVVGAVYERDGRNCLAKPAGHPLVITRMDETSLGTQSTHQAKVALFWAAILGVPGLLVLWVAGREIVRAVGRLLSGV
jgi:hypothetical protein